MKFISETISRCSPRLGILKEFERIPDVSFETPFLMMYTKYGSIPHITKDVLEMQNLEQPILSISLPSTLKMASVIKDVNTTLADFIGMKEYINFLSIQDPAVSTPPGFHQSQSISIWNRTGRHIITADKYMDIVEAFKPDMYVALCNGDTSFASTKKQVDKAVDYSNYLLEECLTRHTASQNLKLKGILGAVEGGYDLKARDRSIKFLKDKPLSGFVIDGLHNNGPDVKDISIEQITSIIEHTIIQLPPEKLRVSMGGWNPVVVLDLINLGIDVFDSTYVYFVTESSKALTFMCDNASCENSHSTLDQISIEEKRYNDDFSPICQNCECLTCKNHSRAYLHHLHHTKEMLGKVLLMIHNTHHYLHFFKTIREALRNSTFHSLRTKIKTKFLQERRDSV